MRRRSSLAVVAAAMLAVAVDTGPGAVAATAPAAKTYVTVRFDYSIRKGYCCRSAYAGRDRFRSPIARV